MEFKFNLSQLLRCDDQGIGIIKGEFVSKAVKLNLSIVLDAMGQASSKAQSIKTAITSGFKFINTNQTIYIMCKGNTAFGFIKIGKKNLFIRNQAGTIKEISPICVLDFYVHESQQRSGFGKALFSKMIECESVEARSLGYDRPSEKLLNFLDKYYSLKSYVPQNNNFVVFDDYFESNYNNKDKSSLFDNNFNYKDNGKNEKDNDKSHINRCQTSYYDHIDTLKKQEQLNDKYNKYSKFQGVTKSETKLKTREYNVNLNLKDNDLDDIEKKFSKVNINDEYEPKKKQKRNSAEHRIEDYYQNLIKPSNKKNPPWAVSDSYNAFMPTSSSYGAYFKVNKKYR